MRKLDFFVMAMLLAVTTSASAQFTNATGKNLASPLSETSDKGWYSVYFQWNPSSIEPKSGDSQSFTGLSIGYDQAFNIASGIPLFVGVGIALQYSFYSEDLTDKYFSESSLERYENRGYDVSVEEKMNMLSAKIPVNLIYKFNIPNHSVAISPYAGLTLRGNILGTLENECGADFNKVYEYSIDDDRKDMFNKKDMGKNAVCSRFQIGWQVGVNVFFGEQVYAGISYGKDFSEICKRNKIHTTSITLGYAF